MAIRLKNNKATANDVSSRTFTKSRVTQTTVPPPFTTTISLPRDFRYCEL